MNQTQAQDHPTKEVMDQRLHHLQQASRTAMKLLHWENEAQSAARDSARRGQDQFADSLKRKAEAMAERRHCLTQRIAFALVSLGSQSRMPITMAESEAIRARKDLEHAQRFYRITL